MKKATRVDTNKFNIEDIRNTEWELDTTVANETDNTNKECMYKLDSEGRRMVKTPEGWKLDRRPSRMS